MVSFNRLLLLLVWNIVERRNSAGAFLLPGQTSNLPLPSHCTRQTHHVQSAISTVSAPLTRPIITPRGNILRMNPFSDTEMSLSLLLLSYEVTPTAATPPPASPPIVTTGNNPTTDTLVFIIGLIPFLWATVEFWRRIAVGASFGTGADSVVIIGEDDKPASSRGRRVLGKGALAVAYVLFGVAALSVGIAVFSVLTSAPTGV
mmetsp:Transcript_65544/g.77606  ORF Transcript_65544/g.77606 Transcript_65544/m.77606 type:complete len:203 (-) Transcript_65544:232-840(-)